MSKNDFKKIAVIAALAGDSKKASPVRVYDLGGKSPLADYAVLMEVESAPQLDAVEEEVSIRLKHQGVYCLHKEGQNSKNWKVLDYGGVLVHVYEKKAEEYYAIAKHYAENKPVEWEEKPAPAPAVAARKPVEAPAEKPAAKKAEVKKPAAKKPAAKKPAAKKPAKKAPVKKAAVKKAVKKAGVKKAAAKKPAVKKSAVKKDAPKKAAFKKKAAKRAPVRKAAKVKKAKPAAKKVSKKKK